MIPYQPPYMGATNPKLGGGRGYQDERGEPTASYI